MRMAAMKECPECGDWVREVCWVCLARRLGVKRKEEEPGNTSTNIGIPEKRRGWEAADRQYNGFFLEDYW